MNATKIQTGAVMMQPAKIQWEASLVPVTRDLKEMVWTARVRIKFHEKQTLRYILFIDPFTLDLFEGLKFVSPRPPPPPPLGPILDIWA